MSDKKRYPITRVQKFYDYVDFDLENGMAREFMEGDLNFTVVLFRVNRIKSQTDETYGEPDVEEIQFYPPVELKVRPNLESSESKTYSEGYGRYEDYGNLIFTIFNEQLEELGIDITYGDFIGYADRVDNIKYFTVSDDGKINTDNAKTRVGYKSYYRTITCVTADPEEFNG
tara:strand:- start:980 stop:1495 length:516 start_codon:yes stop_codon:yes gene_type:complete